MGIEGSNWRRIAKQCLGSAQIVEQKAKVGQLGGCEHPIPETKITPQSVKLKLQVSCMCGKNRDNGKYGVI